MRDVVIRGELYCSKSDWDLIFVPSKTQNALKKISEKQAFQQVAETAFGDSPVFRSDCNYQSLTASSETASAFWNLIVEIPSNETSEDKIHVWFIKTL